MRLLIDGHNLIGQMQDIRLDDPHDEARLALRLKQYCLRYNHHCTVIFDNGITGGYSRLSSAAVTVIFAPHGTTADSLLIRRIHTLSDTAGMAVVTSDRAIVSEAERRSLPVIRSAAFAAILAAPLQATDRNIDAGENPNPVITAAEIAYWLEVFGALETPTPDDEFKALRTPPKPGKNGKVKSAKRKKS